MNEGNQPWITDDEIIWQKGALTSHSHIGKSIIFGKNPPTIIKYIVF